MEHETACPELEPYAPVAMILDSSTHQSALHSHLYQTVTMDDLEALDPEYVRQRLSNPPFVSIPGVVNVRDLGSYPTKYPGMMTRPNIMYRSGEISKIAETGT
jgi:hypothetical protein